MNESTNDPPNDQWEPKAPTKNFTPNSTRSNIPSFFHRIAQLAWARVTETRETIAYVILSFVTAIFCIVLEAMVLKAHSDEANSVWSSKEQVKRPLNIAYADTWISLTRLQNENIFFITFQIFQTYLGIDSVVRQNLMQIMAHTIIIFFCAIFALVQLGETLKFKANLWSTDMKSHIDTDDAGFLNALKYEIAIAVGIAVLTLIFIYLCKKLSQQFGWNIYKRIGADLKMQKRYRLYQLFIMNLKLDAFFELVFSIFWLVAMVQASYQTGNAPSIVWFAIHIILTVVLIPSFFLARYGARTERPIIMWLFLAVQLLELVDFCIILQQSAVAWVFWVFVVCVAIILSLSTFVLTILLTKNFGQGLKPHIQRLFDENYKDFFDSARNPNVKPSNTQDSWVIEDIENTPENSRPPTRNATRTGWKWASKGRSKQTAAHDVNMEKTNMHRYETPTQLEEATELPSTQAPA